MPLWPLRRLKERRTLKSQLDGQAAYHAVHKLVPRSTIGRDPLRDDRFVSCPSPADALQSTREAKHRLIGRRSHSVELRQNV